MTGDGKTKRDKRKEKKGHWLECMGDVRKSENNSLNVRWLYKMDSRHRNILTKSQIATGGTQLMIAKRIIDSQE